MLSHPLVYEVILYFGLDLDKYNISRRGDGTTNILNSIGSDIVSRNFALQRQLVTGTIIAVVERAYATGPGGVVHHEGTDKVLNYLN